MMQTHHTGQDRPHFRVTAVTRRAVLGVRRPGWGWAPETECEDAGEVGGDPDLPGLFARLNRALTEFAAWDRQIRRLLERYGS